MKILSFIIIGILTLTLELSAKTNEIIWLQNQRPPWMINSGQYKNQGYGDKIREIFKSKLTQYTHKTIPINTSRLKIEVQRNKNTCYGPVGKFEAIKSLFHWSKTLYYLPKPHIIVLNSTYKKMGSPKELSMEELIQNQNYNFGNHLNILLYPIDVKKYSNAKNISTIVTSSPTTSLLNMLEKKRIDWIYDSPVFIKWHTSLSKTNDNFKTIKVTETRNKPPLSAYMACSKNDWGKKIIHQINNDINKKNILKIRSYVRKWQLGEENTKEYDVLNTEKFGY